MRPRIEMLFVLVPVLVLSGFGPAYAQPEDDDLPYAEYRDAFIGNHLGGDAGAGGASLQEALHIAFVRARIGLFDVWFPSARLREKEQVDRFKASATALLEVLEHLTQLGC